MSTETKAVRDGAGDPWGIADAGPTLTGAIAADIMGLAWAKDGCSGDHADDIDMACERHGQVQEIVEAAIGKFSAPSAVGDREIPEGWALVPLEPTPEMLRASRRAIGALIEGMPLEERIRRFSRSRKYGFKVPTDQKAAARYRAMVSAAPSPSQGSDTGEAGREPGAYGIPGMPANLSNSDNLRLFSVHHADRLPKAAQDDLCRLADEWDEEVEAARRPAPPPTAPQGADLAGLSEAAWDLLLACEADFSTDHLAGSEDGDHEPVGGGTDGPMHVRFGHMRRLRAELASSDFLVPTTSTPPATAGVVSLLRAALVPFAHYYDLNDCHLRDPDDALEVPIRDLEAAKNALALAYSRSVAPTFGEREDRRERARAIAEATANRWDAFSDTAGIVWLAEQILGFARNEGERL